MGFEVKFMGRWYLAYFFLIGRFFDSSDNGNDKEEISNTAWNRFKNFAASYKTQYDVDKEIIFGTYIIDQDMPVQQAGSNICGKMVLCAIWEIVNHRDFADKFMFLPMDDIPNRDAVITQTVQELADQLQLAISTGTFDGLHYPTIRTAIDATTARPVSPYTRNEKRARLVQMKNAQNEAENERENEEVNDASEVIQADSTIEDNSIEVADPRIPDFLLKGKEWAFMGDTNYYKPNEDGRDMLICGHKNPSKRIKYTQIMMTIDGKYYAYSRTSAQGKNGRTTSGYVCSSCMLANQIGTGLKKRGIESRFSMDVYAKQEGDELDWFRDKHAHHPRCRAVDDPDPFPEDRKLLVPEFATAGVAALIKSGENFNKNLMRNYNVYMLTKKKENAEALKTPFYIGKAMAPFDRLGLHKSYFDRIEKEEKAKAKKEDRSFDQVYDGVSDFNMAILFMHLNPREAEEYEKIMIEVAKAAGIKLLTDAGLVNARRQIKVPEARFKKDGKILKEWSEFLDAARRNANSLIYNKKLTENEDLINYFIKIDSLSDSL